MQTSRHLRKNEKKEHISLFKGILTCLFLSFFAALILTQQDFLLKNISTTPESLVFVLPGQASDWGIDQVHGAADWSYLFEDEKTSDPVYVATDSQQITTQTPQQTPSSTTQNQLPVSEDEENLKPVDKDYFPDE